MKPAFLVLDAQNDFFAADNLNLAEFEATIPVINTAVDLFHSRGWPVIFIQHTSKHLPARSPRWKIHPRISMSAQDIHLTKSTQNAFWNSELESILRSAQVQLVIIAGFLAERCVLTTLRAASERGFEARLLDGAVASLDARYTQFTFEISPHLPLQKITNMVKQKLPAR